MSTEKNAGGGGGNVKQVNRGRQPLTPANHRCVRCDGQLEPSTDGSGNKVNTCQKCGQRHQLKVAPASASAKKKESPAPAERATPTRRATTRPKAAAGKKCLVFGCPGELNAKGNCVCCERRSTFAQTKAQPRDCDLCEGSFTIALDSPNYYSDLCDACRPIAARAANEEASAAA